MSDPVRSDPVAASDNAPEPDRDAKIEQLLLTGLDHYFASEFEQAINVWTRALFLDRNHARARAYIERARGAIAERQRESEELLQNGLAAFTRGAGDEARRLLEDAMNHGAPREEALAVLDRLDRLEQGATPPRQSTTRAERIAAPTSSAAGSRRLGLALTAIALGSVAAIGFYLAALQPLDWSRWFGLETPPAQPVVPMPAEESTFPVPLRGERALLRARMLSAGGHLHDALAALDGVKATDPEIAEADSLRTSIQRQLLALAAVPQSGRAAGSQPGLAKSTAPLP